MKKILILCLSLVFTNLLLAQATISISGPPSVEVGIPYDYTFTFNPQLAQNSNGVAADSYVITEWVVLTNTNGLSASIPGYINTPSNQSSYYNDGTFNNSNPKTVPIQWGNGTFLSEDVITVKISGYYKINATGEAFGYFYLQPQATKNITVQRLIAPIISGASSVADCNQANTTFSISNQTNGNQYLWTSTGSIVSSATASTVTVSPPLTGNFSVNCTVKRSGGNPDYSVIGYKSVTRLPFTSTAVIAGIPTVCTSQPFSVTGLLAGQTVTWSLSNSTSGTLSTTSGNSTTFTKTGGGAVVLTAKILSSCGSQSTNKTKALFAGSPQAFTLVRASNETCDGIKYHYVPFEIFNRNPLITYTFNIAPIPGVAVTQSTQTYNGVIQTVLRFPKTYVGPVNFTVVSSNSCGNFTFSAEEQINSCSNLGLKLSHQLNLFPELPSSNLEPQFINQTNLFSVFPNPAKDFIKIELLTEKHRSIDGNNIYAELFDMMGVKKVYTKLSDFSTSIFTDNLQPGVYILKISIGEIIENHQIIIQ